MRLKQRLLIAMLLPTLLIVVVGAVGVLALDHLRQAAATILDDNYASIQESRHMERALWRIQGADLRRDGGERVASCLAEFGTALAWCRGNLTEHGEEALLERIAAAWAELRPLAASADLGAGEEGRLQSLAGSIHADIARLVDLNEEAMVGHEVRSKRMGRLMIGTVAACGLGAVLALVLFASIWARRVARPVTQVADRLHEALNPEGATAAGKTGDEISRLRAEVDALLGRLDRYETEQNRRLLHLRGRLAFVIDEVREGIVLLDGEQNVVAVNRVARELFGVREEGDGVVGDVAARARIRSLLQPALDRAGDTSGGPGDIRQVVDGEERVYQPRALPFSCAGGTPDGHLLILWDVTEQRGYEEARQHFVSMLSHQLKSPMTSLTMSLNLLRESLGQLTADQGELLSIATEDCNKLAEIISELISAPRWAGPGLTLELQRVDVVPLLRSTLRPLLPQAKERGISLVRPEGSASARVAVDPVKFSWVVTNIAGNALRYTAPGGRITVSVRQHGPEEIEVAVADTGRGIAPGDLEHVFEPYVTPDTEREAGLHGLGLAIAREIVEAHGGRLEAESELGRGTTFHIFIPLEREVST